MNDGRYTAGMSESQNQPARTDIHKTGLVCPSCKQPVAMVVNVFKNVLVMQCQACGNRWSATSPSAPKQ